MYANKNLSLKEVAKRINLTESGTFARLRKLGIKTAPETKGGYLNKATKICIPKEYNPDLAELFGIMLGDGHISRFQTTVTLGSKEYGYVRYVSKLFKTTFGILGTIHRRKEGHHDVYVNSTTLAKWLLSEGLVMNKVKEQVDVPKWIMYKPEYMERFLRGFFDTDGCVYKLRFGIQVSFCNRSLPLLKSTRNMLVLLGYRVSEISLFNLYLTRRSEVVRFFTEIKPMNAKHVERYKFLTK